jgi:hypothetical protein
MNMRITVVSEQRVWIKCCIKLKKNVTETSEILKSAYGEDFLSRTSVFELHKKLNDVPRKWKMQIKKVDKNNVDLIFYAKVIIHHVVK